MGNEGMKQNSSKEALSCSILMYMYNVYTCTCIVSGGNTNNPDDRCSCRDDYQQKGAISNHIT